MRGIIGLAVIFFIALPNGVSAKDDPLVKNFPLNPQKIIYLDCSGTSDHKIGERGIKRKGEWSATAILGDGRVRMQRWDRPFSEFPCELAAAHGLFGCKIRSQKHGYITAGDTYRSKEDKKAGRKPQKFENIFLSINRYSGSISFQATYTKGFAGGFYMGRGTCTVGKQLF